MSERPTFDSAVTCLNDYVKQNREQRIGQAYFNALYGILPEFANKIRATKFDPFHDDTRIGAFFSALSDHLTKIGYCWKCREPLYPDTKFDLVSIQGVMHYQHQ